MDEGNVTTGFSSQIGTKLRDWAVGQAGASCCSQAALPLNESKTRYSQYPESPKEILDATTSGNHCLTTQRLKTMPFVLFTSSVVPVACKVLRCDLKLSTTPFMYIAKFPELS